MKSVLLMVFGVLLPGAVSADTCDQEEIDSRVYSFAYGPDFLPYIINQDGELHGLAYNLIRAICKIMNKQCRHTVIYDYTLCWDESATSHSLNNQWWDACVAFAQTRVRLSSLAFVAEFAQEPVSFLYVKSGERTNTLQEIRDSREDVGFQDGWFMNPDCLERTFSLQLGSRAKPIYKNYNDISEALDKEEIVAMLVHASDADHDRRFERVNTDEIRCALSGLSVMARKDVAQDLRWMDDGLQKIKENGDYDWYCNIAAKDGEPNCL